MRMCRARAHDVGGDSFAGMAAAIRGVVIQCCFVIAVGCYVEAAKSS